MQQQRICMAGATSSNSFSECNSPLANLLGESRFNKNGTKSIKNPSRPLTLRLIVDNSFVVCNDLLSEQNHMQEEIPNTTSSSSSPSVSDSQAEVHSDMNADSDDGENRNLEAASSQADFLTTAAFDEPVHNISHHENAGPDLLISILPFLLPTAGEAKSHRIPDIATDLKKIVEAVNYSYKLQPVKGVTPESDDTFNAFEKLIHNFTPVVGQTYCNGKCESCSREGLIGNFSLGNLWNWYEEPGCFGLEVKAEDSLCNGSHQFSAYFVPYLSGMQLFGHSSSTENSCRERLATNTSEVAKNISSLPIFLMLLPRPRKEMTECLSESSSSSSSRHELSNRAARNTCDDDAELIFEYFESGQPHQRPPLFEKIKELVRDGDLSNFQLFGDPLKLECLNLHDLHPASWYSVAWYPIYRIPRGSFHAAFLTYHSLGHFVHRSASLNPSDDLREIVSPIIGLQSYKAKVEGWFNPRGSKCNAVDTENMEERLRRLERTASVIATASVRKGDQKSVNKQPDFDFFSRWP